MDEGNLDETITGTASTALSHPPDIGASKKTLTDHEVAAKNNEYPANSKAKLIHRVVRGWENTETNNTTKPDEEREVPHRPPSPTIPPPELQGTALKFYCLGPSLPSTTTETALSLDCSTATSLLCHHWRCSNTVVSDAGRSYAKIASYQKDTAIEVCFWEPITSKTHLVEEEKACYDQTLLCIPMNDIVNDQESANDGIKETVAANGTGSIQLWDPLEKTIREWKSIIDQREMSQSIVIVLIGVVKPSSSPTFTDFSGMFSSESFVDNMTTLCDDLKIAKWYSPILQVEEDGVTPTATTETPRLNKKRKLAVFDNWKQEHSIDYCFQTMIEQTVSQKEKLAPSELDVDNAVPNEANNERDLQISVSPSSSKKGKGNDPFTPQCVVIDLTATVSNDVDDHVAFKVPVVTNVSSARKQRPKRSFVPRTRH
jgi:hypothetical protein